MAEIERLPIDDLMERIERAEPGRSITFDDILITPGYSDTVPRDVDVRTRLTAGIQMGIPLVSADMDTVTEAKLAVEMAKAGGIGFLWKHPNPEIQVGWVNDVKYTLNARIDKPITIGVGETAEKIQEILRQYGNRFSSLVVVDDAGKVAGLVTRDRSQFANPGEKIKDFMVQNPLKLSEDPGVNGAYKFMKEKRVGKLILTTSDGKLDGLYCFGDVKSIVEGKTSMYNRDERGQLRIGANVGVRDFERAEKLLEAKCDVLLVGTAHGHSKNVIETVKELKSQFSKYAFDIVAGNVVTYGGAKDLFEAGADAVKVGIGPGSICTTRVVTGAGMPQVTAVYDVARAARKFGRYVIADGGIKSSGELTKIIAVGADVVMLGSLLAASDEAVGGVVTRGGRRFKPYRGMGSEGAMQDSQAAKERYQQGGAEKLVPEGVEGMVPARGPVSEIIYQLVGGLRAGMGYAGARNIQELRKAKINRPSSAGQIESHPHNISITKEPSNYTVPGEK